MVRRRLSLPALQALAVMLEEPSAQYWGLAIAKRIGIPTGTVYPLLHRLQAMGWLESALEDDGPYDRPPRRLYRLTPTGVQAGRQEVLAAQQSLTAVLRTPFARPAQGAAR